MSFLRYEEIYRPISSSRSRYDEFPAGYSLAGCAPAEPASASPAESHREARGRGSTIEKQQTACSVLTTCLTQRDNLRKTRAYSGPGRYWRGACATFFITKVPLCASLRRKTSFLLFFPYPLYFTFLVCIGITEVRYEKLIGAC